MSKTTIIKKKANKLLKNSINKDDAKILNKLFNQLIGAENADPEILIPKYVQIKNCVRKYYKILDSFLKFEGFRKMFNEYESDLKMIESFNNNLKKTFIDIDFKKKEDTIDEYKSLNEESINNLYKKYVVSDLIKSIIITSGNLKPHFKYFEHINKIEIGKSDLFIKREPGLTFIPLDYSELDFKKLWFSDKITDIVKKYILNIFNHLYNIGHELYKNLNSPNINVKKFSSILIKEIDKMRDKIPRCKEAFDVIQQSVDILENNFDQYYKDSVESENFSMIMESFISDVVKVQKADTLLTHQFRKIISFIKKMSAGNNDPMVQELFRLLKTNFKLMEKYTPKLNKKPTEKIKKTTINDEEIEKDKQEYEKLFQNITEQQFDNNLISSLIEKSKNLINIENQKKNDNPKEKPKSSDDQKKNDDSDKKPNSDENNLDKNQS